MRLGIFGFGCCLSRGGAYSVHVEVIVQDVPDGIAGLGTAGRLLDDGGHQDLRVVEGGEGGDDAVVGFIGGHLGGTGLAADRNGIILEDGGRGAQVHNALHTLLDGLEDVLGHADLAHDLRGLEEDGLTGLIVPDLLDDMGGPAGPAVEDRGDIAPDLQGGEHIVGLSDGGLQGIAGSPGGESVLVAVGGSRQDAGVLGQLDAGGLAETPVSAVLVHLLDGELAAHVEEEVVAGLLNGLHHLDLAVDLAVQQVQPAPGSIAGVGVVHVLALGVDDGIPGDGPLHESRGGHADLEGGAGRVSAEEGTVEHGGVLVGVQEGVILLDGGQVIGGVGGDGDNGIVLGIQHGHGPDVGILAGERAEMGGALPNAEDVFRQGVLGDHLHIDVNGQVQIAPGLRLLRDLGFHHGAVGVLGDGHKAVGSVEILLESGLATVPAHQGVVGVSQGLEIVGLGRRDPADPAEDMGQVAGIMIDAGGLHPVLEAPGVQLPDAGDEGQGHVLGHGIGLQGGELRQGHIQAAEKEGGGDAVGIAVVIIGLAGIRVPLQGQDAVMEHDGAALLVHGGVVLHVQLAHQAPVPASGGGILESVRIPEGDAVGGGLHQDRLLRRNQLVLLSGAGGDTVQVQQHGVDAFVVPGHGLVIQADDAGLPVGNEGGAVCVEDLPALGLDGLRPGPVHGALGHGIIILARNLQVQQAPRIDGGHEEADHRQGEQSRKMIVVIHISIIIIFRKETLRGSFHMVREIPKGPLH